MTALAYGETRTLIDELLAQQQQLTAVDRFAQRHEQDSVVSRAKLYSELLPASPPAPGEQYAFAVDLDACSGCKACVAACHSLNGLDEEETWRSVGLLIGGTCEAPVQQTVTTACHHCLDPACLNGCPVLAYEKDTVTGIVRHLDDQCIGCQYCVLKCPYDVPKYSPSRGIVRKCDMCASRIAVNEAPACAQACPNAAIRIAVINIADTAAAAGRGEFLPGAPDPRYTLPTTRYSGKRNSPANLSPADDHDLKPGHSHPPLVAMLVLTQLSVGAFCAATLLRALFPANLMMQLSRWHSLVAVSLGMLALGASTLHLGRPLYAWRAVIGLRTSWLSREIVVFGLFAALALLEAAAFWLVPLRGFSSVAMSATVSLDGLLGVFCSLMIYHDTRRKLWSGAMAALKFFGTTALLGTAVILFLTTLQALLSPNLAAHGAYHQLTTTLALVLVATGAVKLGAESLVFLHLRRGDLSSLNRTARLMKGELAEATTARFLLGFIGSIVFPLAFLVQKPAPGFATLGVTLSLMVFALLGEFLERYLFFAAVVPARMPGGIGT